MRPFHSLILACVFAFPVVAAEPAAGVQVPQELKSTYAPSVSIRYQFFLPVGYGQTDQKWPLLVFLHGAGESGDDLEKVKIHGPPKLVETRPGDFPFVIASPQVLDDVMYKAIAVGFAFFTIATVLGALWAADAWGGYWSWDPKETWALIVWLNYAAWLHMRLVKGLRGTVAAWWALAGLAVTTFAFLGVNMFLSGLHSYGTL